MTPDPTPGEECPECHHDLIGHYGMIRKGELVTPYPTECQEGCGCMYAFKRLHESFTCALIDRKDLVTVCEMQLGTSSLPSDMEKEIRRLPDEVMAEIALAMQNELSGMFYHHLNRAALPILQEERVFPCQN